MSVSVRVRVRVSSAFKNLMYSSTCVGEWNLPSAFNNLMSNGISLECIRYRYNEYRVFMYYTEGDIRENEEGSSI